MVGGRSPPGPVSYPRGVKEFAVYTALRLGLFVVCYAVLGGLYLLLFGDRGLVIWPFLLAVVVSSVLSVSLLRRQREAFALRVQQRADRAAARFEERRSREDAD